MINGSLISHFNFFELWNPIYIIITVACASLYLIYVGPLRNRYNESEPVTVGKKTLFILGLITFYIALGSPLNVIGHHLLFSAHMMKQSLLYFVMPPLLLLGTPTWMIKPLIGNRFISKMGSFLTQPILSMFVFNAALSAYHFPIIFNKTMEYPLLGGAYQLFLIVTSFFMWWVLLCPVPELDKLSNLKKLGYIVGNAILLYPACVAIIFSGNILYEHYANAPLFIRILTPKDDQQFGGIIMKLVQEAAFVVTLGIIFTRWYRAEKHDDDPRPAGMIDQKEVDQF